MDTQYLYMLFYNNNQGLNVKFVSGFKHVDTYNCLILFLSLSLSPGTICFELPGTKVKRISDISESEMYV